MTVYEVNAPHHVTTTGFRRRFSTKLVRMIKGMQYSRMMSVLIQLSDEQLAEIGIQRQDIPAHARECIYGASPDSSENGA